MIQHEFEELLEQFSQDELNEKSTVKGQFTSYIIRRMEWHAIRYAAKNMFVYLIKHFLRDLDRFVIYGDDHTVHSGGNGSGNR